MAKLKIKWGDLEETLDIDDYDNAAYIDTETGAIIVKDEYITGMLAGIFYDEDTAIEEIIGEIEEIVGTVGEGEIEAITHLLGVERDKSGRYLDFPSRDSRDGYRDMEAYIESLEDEHLAELLSVAIEGKGAFRRFKDTLLHYPDARERWFIFEATRKQKRALEWLSDNDIEAEFE